jgi:hypothetical protein
MRAVMTAVFNVGNVQLMNTGGDPESAAWGVGKEDGPGPVPAAEAVLERHGWKVAGDWQQTAGGVSGGVWGVEVELAEDDDEDGCEGHPAGPYDEMGTTVYCDGTCR